LHPAVRIQRCKGRIQPICQQKGDIKEVASSREDQKAVRGRFEPICQQKGNIKEVAFGREGTKGAKRWRST